MYGSRNRMTTRTSGSWRSLRRDLMPSQVPLSLIAGRGVFRLIIGRTGLQILAYLVRTNNNDGRQTIVPTATRNAATTWYVAILFRMPVRLFFGKPCTSVLAARTKAYLCAEIGSSGRRGP